VAHPPAAPIVCHGVDVVDTVTVCLLYDEADASCSLLTIPPSAVPSYQLWLTSRLRVLIQHVLGSEGISTCTTMIYARLTVARKVYAWKAGNYIATVICLVCEGPMWVWEGFPGSYTAQQQEMLSGFPPVIEACEVMSCRTRL
jgi:hypothetical protein